MPLASLVLITPQSFAASSLVSPKYFESDSFAGPELPPVVVAVALVLVVGPAVDFGVPPLLDVEHAVTPHTRTPASATRRIVRDVDCTMLTSTDGLTSGNGLHERLTARVGSRVDPAHATGEPVRGRVPD
jgi:hypothetical protein